MSKILVGQFDTRRQADLAVERLVQEIGIERTDIFVASSGPDNSTGTFRAGADSETVGEPARDDVQLAGAVTVSVDVQNDNDVQRIISAIKEMNGIMEGD